MANVFSPLGFDPGGRHDGASWSANMNGSYRILYSNTHQLYRGDICVMLSSGYIDTLAPGTTPPLGIFWGCQYVSASQRSLVFSQSFPGADQITNGIVQAFVIDDPNVQFWVQTGWSGGTPAAATQAMVGMNAQYNNGTANVPAQMSGAYIDLNVTPAVTATFPFRIMALQTDPPGANGTDTTSAYNNVLVAWNNQFYSQLTGI